MKSLKFTLLLLAALLSTTVIAQKVKFSHFENKNTETFVLQNGLVKQSIVIKNKKLLVDLSCGTTTAAVNIITEQSNNIRFILLHPS